jgi:hypothetical protein
MTANPEKFCQKFGQKLPVLGGSFECQKATLFPTGTAIKLAPASRPLESSVLAGAPGTVGNQGPSRHFHIVSARSCRVGTRFFAGLNPGLAVYGVARPLERKCVTNFMTNCLLDDREVVEENQVKRKLDSAAFVRGRKPTQTAPSAASVECEIVIEKLELNHKLECSCFCTLDRRH